MSKIVRVSRNSSVVFLKKFHFLSHLKLPDAKVPREIHLKADKGEIDVFLCPDDTYQQPPCDPLLDDIRPIVTPIVEKYLSPRNKNGSYFCTFCPVVGLY